MNATVKRGMGSNTCGLVADQMRQRIQGGAWRVGQMLPGRRALATEYGVALATLERAVTVLTTEGLLSADPRRGTFVATPSMGTSGRTAVGNSSDAFPREPLCVTVVIVTKVEPYAASEDFQSQWPLQVLHACEDALGSIPGASTRFVNTRTSESTDKTQERLIDEIGGLAANAVVFIEVSDHRRLLSQAQGIPVVCVTFDGEDVSEQQVSMDTAYGGMQAARHLLSQGFRRLLFFRPYDAKWVATRLAGARASVAGFDSRVPELSVWPPEPGSAPPSSTPHRQVEMARQSADDLLAFGFDRGTGVIAANDDIAMAFVGRARAHGLNAGRDYGIIGFDDRARDAELSSMRPPLYQMGIEAARMVERTLRGDAVASRMMLRHRLIPRASTRRLQDSVGERPRESAIDRKA